MSRYLLFIALITLASCAGTPPRVGDSDKALYHISSYNIENNDQRYQIIPIIKRAPYSKWRQWFYGTRDASAKITITSIYMPEFGDYFIDAAGEVVISSLLSSVVGGDGLASNTSPAPPSLSANLKIYDSATDETIYHQNIIVYGDVSMGEDPCNRKGNSEQEILESMACRLNLKIQTQVAG